jgi:trimethylamine--corrinoid protein Co-methyltransferase
VHHQPLGHDGGSLEAGLAAAEAGLPVGYMTMASCGSTGPVTLAGNLVVGNAEVLTALALMQMAYPGCPVYYAAAQTSTDLRTGAYTGGGPEDYLFGAATNVLADFYKVPLSVAYAIRRKNPTGKRRSTTACPLYGRIHPVGYAAGAGLLHGSRILRHEMLLMDSKSGASCIQRSRGLSSMKKLAVDAIRGRARGNFLAQRHTRQHSAIAGSLL